jgi:hypothetical protein
MPAPFLCHCHIPKTGGSALNRRYLYPRFSEDRVYQLYRYVFECAGALPQRHVSRAMRTYAGTGHVPYGFFRRVHPKAVYVSVFRAPEARFVSFLNFVLASDKHMVRKRVGADVLRRAETDPDSFVTAVLDDPLLEVVHSNVQTRLAAGRSRLGEAPVTGDDLEAARFNLAQPDYLAGDQDNLAAFIALMAERFGPVAQKVRSSPQLEKRLTRHISLEMLGPKALKRVRAANELDLRLYEIVAGDRKSMTKAA